MSSPPLGRPLYSVRTEGKPRLLDRVCETQRPRHYHRRTKQAYIAWLRRLIFLHGNRHPPQPGAAEVARFLSAFAVRLSASSMKLISSL